MNHCSKNVAKLSFAVYSARIKQIDSCIYLVHGLFGNKSNFNSIAKRLSQTKNIVTLDLRNHGESKHLPGNDLNACSEDVSQTISSFPFKFKILAGHSLGGKVVMYSALKHPELTHKLIVLDIAPRLSQATTTVRPMLEAMRNLDLAYFTEKYSAKIPLVRKELDQYWRKEIPDPQVRAFILTNLTQDVKGNVAWKINLEAIHKDFDHIVGWPYDELQEKTFNKPTLFIRGENSAYIQNSDMDNILSYFPKARLETIPRAGHWVHADNPNDTIECILDFISH